MSFHPPAHYMVEHPFLGMGDGRNGFFKFERAGIWFQCIASDGMGWEHVSVTLNKKRTPTWEEMCLVKSIFWDDDDCVVQYHPPKSDYVNNHRHCLHLWRPIDVAIARPEKIMVGI